MKKAVQKVLLAMAVAGVTAAAREGLTQIAALNIEELSKGAEGDEAAE